MHKKIKNEMKEKVIIRVVSVLIAPFVALYAMYVQLNGEYSPGGGFQAGVILAAPIILFSLVSNTKIIFSIISMSFSRIMAAMGVLIYAGTGLVGILCGKNFLDYSVFSKNFGQKLGVTLVELGVGITVFFAILIIYFSFTEEND